MFNKLMNKGQKQLVFAPSSLILANYSPKIKIVYYSDIYKILKIYKKQICKYLLHIIQPVVRVIYTRSGKLTDAVIRNRS